MVQDSDKILFKLCKLRQLDQGLVQHLVSNNLQQVHHCLVKINLKPLQYLVIKINLKRMLCLVIKTNLKPLLRLVIKTKLKPQDFLVIKLNKQLIKLQTYYSNNLNNKSNSLVTNFKIINKKIRTQALALYLLTKVKIKQAMNLKILYLMM